MTTCSVVIATADRPQSLDRCLAALAADACATRREILVVDNAPPTVTERPGVRVLREARPGKSHALNTGVAAATGDVVLFLDDDVLVRPGWTDALVAAALTPGAGVVAGRVLPRWEAAPPGWLLGPHAVHLTLVDRGLVDRVLAPSEPPYGASMAVRADVLAALEPPFDPRLGPRPRLKLGHEEAHLADRVRRLGLEILHCAAAVSEHVIDPARMDRRRLRRIVLQSGVGAARRQRLLGVPVPPLPRRCAEAAISLLRAGRRAVLPAGTAAQVDLETGAWAALGERIERLAGRRWPGAVDWVASRLAGYGPA